MCKNIVALGTVLAVASCTLLSGCTFTKAAHSGEKKQPISFYLLPQTTPDSSHTKNTPGAILVEDYIDNDKELKDLLDTRSCRLRGQKALPAAAIPVIIAAGKLAFDLYMDAQIRKQEQIKKAAQSSYSERLIVSGEDLRKHSCLLLFRGLTDKTADLVAVLQLISTSSKAFQIQPLYIRARNAVAVTGEGESGKAPSINISIAVSVKALVSKPLGVTSLYPIGEGAVSVPNVEIGPEAHAYICTPASANELTKPVCPTSDLVAYPEGDAPSSITVAVTETGNVGMDLDQNTAELRAIKEALGPVMKDTLKELVK